MGLQSILSRLLLIGALVGLVGAPLGQASLAATAMQVSSAKKMANDVPCCHDEHPTKDCQKSCPLMAMCANQTLPEAAIWQASVPMRLLAVIRPLGDDPLAGIDSIPPPPPPRSVA